MNKRLRALASGLIGVAIGMVSSAALAQAYPSKTIRLVVPYAAGGPTDIVARLLGQKLSERWNQPVIVDNRPGAGGNIGAEAVARATPDGYTLLLTAAGPIVINEALYAKLPFDPAQDFVPVALLVVAPNILTVSPALNVNSVTDLIALAKAKPGALHYASGGNGTPPHLAGELFKTMAGIDVVHVPYKGGPQASTAVMSNEVAFYFDSPSSLAQAKAGKVKAVAVTSASRAAVAPEIPTVAESGVPGFDVSAWFGLLAPSGTPQDIVARINAEVVVILKQSDVREKLLAIGFDPAAGSPDSFATFIRTERTRWGRVVKSSGARID